MEMVIALIFGGIIWVICKSFRSTVENVKYQHKTCPFCGNDVSGHKEHVAINGQSFINYNCKNCGAYNNRSSKIWYRKKDDNSSDVEMKWES